MVTSCSWSPMLCPEGCRAVMGGEGGAGLFREHSNNGPWLCTECVVQLGWGMESSGLQAGGRVCVVGVSDIPLPCGYSRIQKAGPTVEACLQFTKTLSHIIISPLSIDLAPLSVWLCVVFHRRQTRPPRRANPKQSGYCLNKQRK